MSTNTTWVTTISPGTIASIPLSLDYSHIATAGIFHVDPGGWALVSYAIVLIIVNVFINGLTLLTVLYLNQHGIQPNHILLLGLSSAGAVLALLYLPFILVLLLTGSSMNCHLLCQVLAALERGLIAISTWGTALVALDRYMFINQHATYCNTMTVRRSALSVTGVWCIGTVFGATSLLVSSYTTTPSGTCLCHLTLDFYGIYHLLYSATYITLAFILPTTLVLVFYGFIISGASKQVSSRKTNSDHLTPSHNLPCHIASSTHSLPYKSSNRYDVPIVIRLYEIKTIRVMCLVLVSYLICVSPYFAINVVVSTGQWTLSTFPQNIYLTCILLLHTNSSCSPLLYGFTNKLLRTVLFRFLQQKLGGPSCMNKSQPTSHMMPNGCLSGHQDSIENETSSLSTNSKEAIVYCDIMDTNNHCTIDAQEDKGCQSQTTQLFSKNNYAITPPCSLNTATMSDLNNSTDHNTIKSGASRRGRHGSDPIRTPLVSKNKRLTSGLTSLAETERLLTITEEENDAADLSNQMEMALTERCQGYGTTPTIVRQGSYHCHSVLNEVTDNTDLFIPLSLCST